MGYTKKRGGSTGLFRNGKKCGAGRKRGGATQKKCGAGRKRGGATQKKCGAGRTRGGGGGGGCDIKLKDGGLTALCMRCFHKNGKKNGVQTMSVSGRSKIINKRGRGMIKGKCNVCGGNMFTFC